MQCFYNIFRIFSWIRQGYDFLEIELEAVVKRMYIPHVPHKGEKMERKKKKKIGYKRRRRVVVERTNSW